MLVAVAVAIVACIGSARADDSATTDADPEREASVILRTEAENLRSGLGRTRLARRVQCWLNAFDSSFAVMSTIGTTRS